MPPIPCPTPHPQPHPTHPPTHSPHPTPHSAEGHEFLVDRKCACVSKTIEAMLAGNFAESKGEIRFPEITTNILEKVIQYLYYKVGWVGGRVWVGGWVCGCVWLLVYVVGWVGGWMP